jgi:hypothetical protein
MKLLFPFTLVIVFATNSFATYTDTIDVWTIRLNGRTIINSNQMAIMHDHPMLINLSTLSDNDTLDIYYWTDHGLEKQKWHYIFKDSTNTFLDKFANPIDSAVQSQKFQWRKNYVSFRVGYLRKLSEDKKVHKIFVQFEFDDILKKDLYLGKSICIISND